MNIQEISKEIQNFVDDFPLNSSSPWELMKTFQNHQFEDKSDGYPGVKISPNSKLITGKNCTIQPSAVINGTVILGDNVFIGDYSMLRGFVFIGSNCVIGSYNEISRSIIGSSTKISHRNDIFDSIVGKNCWLTSNVSIHNVRLDLGNISVKWHDKETEIPSRFGCIIEDNVTIGIWAKIMPGTVIPQNKNILGPCLITPRKIRKFQMNSELL